MNNKNLAWLLIIFGVIDIYMWFTDGRGWTSNLLINLMGVNFLSLTSWGFVLTITGMGILIKERAIYQSKIDDIDLDEGESILHKQMSKYVILTLTSKRLRFYGYNFGEFRKSENKNFKLPNSDKEDYYWNDIVSVQPTKQLGISWGVTITLSNGDNIHIPITEGELISKRIEKQLNQSS